MQNRMVLFLLLLLMVPAGLAAQQPLQLSLKDAVDAAIEPEGNTRVQLAREAIRQAEAHAAEARADLLPDLSASVGQQSRTRSLTEMGLRSDSLFNGSALPSVVGPFNTFDARGTFSQKVFDFSAIRRYQAARTDTQAAREESETAKEETAAEVARAYLVGVRDQALVKTAQANVQLSEALLSLANSQKEAGTGTGIEVTRAQVQLANDRQRLLVAQADLTKARLQLLKALGVELDVRFTFTNELSYAPAPAISIKEAVAAAYESLPELRAQRKHEESASLNHSAANFERLPSVVAFGDYGTVGLSANQTSPTRTYGASIRIPIFDGGRREAHRAESLSILKQERIRSADLEKEIQLKIRVALDAVDSADAQVQAAEDGLALSNQELEQAERRYRAGVGASIEVTDAQTRLQRSRENQISAIFNHAVARVDLAAAMGNIHELISNWR